MKVKQVAGTTMEINDMWDFLEEFMTDYARDQRIADSDRLIRFQHDEIFDPQDIIDFGFENMTIEQAEREEIEVNYSCLVEALENFIARNSKAPEVFKIKVAFGSELCREINDNDDFNIDDFDDANMEGEIHLYQFDTKGELDAFIKGLYVMMGWRDYCIID